MLHAFVFFFQRIADNYTNIIYNYVVLCACTDMLWMCVLYVSFGSKVRSRTFGCAAMGSAVLFILISRLLLYSSGSGENKV